MDSNIQSEPMMTLEMYNELCETEQWELEMDEQTSTYAELSPLQLGSRFSQPSTSYAENLQTVNHNPNEPTIYIHYNNPTAAYTEVVCSEPNRDNYEFTSEVPQNLVHPSYDQTVVASNPNSTATKTAMPPPATPQPRYRKFFVLWKWQKNSLIYK